MIIKRLPCERCGAKKTTAASPEVTAVIGEAKSGTYRLCDECRELVQRKFAALNLARTRTLIADFEVLVNGR